MLNTCKFIDKRLDFISLCSTQTTDEQSHLQIGQNSTDLFLHLGMHSLLIGGKTFGPFAFPIAMNCCFVDTLFQNTAVMFEVGVELVVQ